MAQVKLLKIDTDGIPVEMDTASDDITLASFTVTGGGPVLNANLDMNNGNVSDINDISFTDPTTDGITRTDGTHAADDIMMEDAENSMASGAAVLFPVVTDNADQLDAFRLPAIAGVPSATPTDGGEGYLVWDSSNNHLYAWDGAAWDNLSTVDSANRVCNTYTVSEVGGVALGDLVYISAADTVSKADAGTNYQVIGMAGAAIADTASGEVCSEGVITGLTGLTAGSRYFLSSTAGAYTTTVPTGSGNRIVQVGYAKSTTEMHLQIQVLGRRA